MKAKLLFILLSVLFIIPINAATPEKQKNQLLWKFRRIKTKVRTRSPFIFDINVQEVDNCLQIIFLSPLPDAEITIMDQDGNVVVHEQQAFIHEGKILYIYTPNAYPYTVEITSPSIDITGEIVEENNE